MSLKYEKLARILAVTGGLLLLATACMVTTSVILSTKLFNSNVKGDFEMAQMANALAIFCFLPLTQARSGHVFVDSFTNWLPERFNELLDGLWTLLMFALLALISYRTLIGSMDALKANMQTMVLTLPQAPPIFICSLLAGVAAFYALIVSINKIRGTK